MQAIAELLSEQSFMPHGHCYLWTPAMVWLQVITNGLTGFSYVAISLTLVGFIRRVEHLPFRFVYLAFGAFIIACGFTHFMDIWVIWEPRYWLDVAVRSITALASVGTAAALPRYIPKAVALAQSTQRMRSQGVALEAALDDLGTMYQRTRELDQLKSDFFANASHELRTPLTLILAPLESQLRSTKLPPEVRADLEIMQRNAQILLSHVTDLLDIQKADAGKLEPSYSALDLAELVRETAASFAGLSRERDVELTLSLPRALEAELDATQIKRVLLNLLSNAFKFSPHGGSVRVELAAREGDTLAVIRIEDDGPGVPAAEREHVFARYSQADAGPARRTGGTGLGLSIVRELAELHGGSVHVKDGAQGGALFELRLPRKAPHGLRADTPLRSAVALVPTIPPQIEPATTDRDRQDDERACILVAEDNPDMLRLISAMLSPAYRVLEARDGAEALALARLHEPDLVLTDMMMPTMSGEQLLVAMRADRALADMPVLLLSAKTDSALRARMLGQGARDYVLKPFARDELLARVSNLVSMHRAQRMMQKEVEAQQADIEAMTRVLVQQKRRLEEALGEASEARATAERANRQKSDFLSLISHELRTPLTSIRLQVERLFRGLPGALNDAQREIVEKISRSSVRLLDMVDALLQFGKLEAGRLAPEHVPLDVLAIARDTLDDLRAKAEAKTLGLTLQSELHDAPIAGDPRLVRLILTNLCDNAIKYTDEGEVVVTVQQLPDLRIRVSVRDTGPGIAESAHALIFQPFEQLEDLRHKQRTGVGLGLALVRRVASLIHAEIALTSHEGHGSCFEVTFAARAPGTTGT